MMKYILQELKIDHYIKNLVDFIPFILGFLMPMSVEWKEGALLFLCFCFVSSSIYIINDLKDKQKDNRHPVKKSRPIAANQISVAVAVKMIGILWVMAGLLTLCLPERCWLWIWGYVVLNIIYIYKLRDIFYIDVCCVAIGFLLRVMAGYRLIKIGPDWNILMCVFFVSCCFTCLKRKMEISLLKGNPIHYRKSIKQKGARTFDLLASLNAVVAGIFFVVIVNRLYDPIMAFFILVSFLLFGIRLMKLSNREIKNDDPAYLMKTDGLLKIWGCLWIGFILIGRYY